MFKVLKSKRICFGVIMWLLAFWLVVFWGTKLEAQGTAYPEENITIIVPYRAGGGFDITARFFAKVLPKYLPKKVSVIIQNIPGAGGVVGIKEFIKAKPDGYNLISVDLQSLATMSRRGELGSFDVRTLTYLVQQSAAATVVIIGTGGKFKTLEDLKGKVIRFSAISTDMDVGSKAIAGALGSKAAYVHFTGSGEYVLAVARGDADITWGSAATMKRNIKALEGKVKPILVIGDKDPDLPGVPTHRELGLDLDETAVAVRYIIVAPPNMPGEVKKVLDEAIDKVVRDPEYVELMNRALFPVTVLRGAEFQKVVNHTVDVFEKFQEKEVSPTK